MNVLSKTSIFQAGITVIFLFAYQYRLSAQLNFEYSYGEPDRKFSKAGFVQADEESFVAYRYSNDTHGLYLYKYDYQYNLKNKIALGLKKRKFEKVVRINDKCVVLSSKYDKRYKSMNIYADVVDLNSFSQNVAEQRLTYFICSHKVYFNDFDIIHSPNKNFHAFYAKLSSPHTTKAKIGLALIDTSWNRVYSSEFLLDKNETDKHEIKQSLLFDERFFLISATFGEENQFFLIRNGKIQKKTIKPADPSDRIFDHHFFFDNDKNLMMTGLIGPQSKYEKSLNSFVKLVDLNDSVFVIEEDDKSRIGNSDMVNLLTGMVDLNMTSNYLPISHNPGGAIWKSNLIQLENNKFLLAQELQNIEQFHTVSYTGNIPNHSYWSEYFYGVIVLTLFDELGNHLWSVSIDKEYSSYNKTDGTYYIHYFKDLFIFYKNNENHVKESGKSYCVKIDFQSGEVLEENSIFDVENSDGTTLTHDALFSTQKTNKVMFNLISDDKSDGSRFGYLEIQ